MTTSNAFAAISRLALCALLALGATSPTRAGETITFFHNDVAGSPAVATDVNGIQAWKETYRPYGDQLVDSAASTNNKLWFTGKSFDDSTGLSYMGARYYDPTLGRFMAVDPAPFKFDNLHSFNRYTYANNNPYKFVDPDGREGKIATLVQLTANGMKKLARLTQEQAVQARRAEKNVVADTQQAARQIENAADGGRGNVIKHSGHELKDGSKGLPHYQAEGRKGHTFWGAISAAAFAIADGLDQTAEAADTVDPLNYLTSGDPGELENHEKTWWGAYEQIDPNGIDYLEAFRRKQEELKQRAERKEN